MCMLLLLSSASVSLRYSDRKCSECSGGVLMTSWSLCCVCGLFCCFWLVHIFNPLKLHQWKFCIWSELNFRSCWMLLVLINNSAFHTSWRDRKTVALFWFDFLDIFSSKLPDSKKQADSDGRSNIFLAKDVDTNSRCPWLQGEIQQRDPWGWKRKRANRGGDVRRWRAEPCWWITRSW